MMWQDDPILNYVNVFQEINYFFSILLFLGDNKPDKIHEDKEEEWKTIFNGKWSFT